MIGLVHRVNTTAADVIENISVVRYENITNALGLNSTNVSAEPNIGSALWHTGGVYSDALGIVAWVILFSIPFIGMWVAQKDMVPAGIVGIFIGLYVFAYIGNEYLFFGMAMIAIAITSIVWSLYQKRG